MKKLKILLVDDHKLVRDGIRFIMSEQTIYEAEIDEVENGSDAISMIRELHYDIIIMDINMPQIDGIEATKQIMQIRPQAKILALSMYDEEYHVIKMMRAGVQGYILKSAGSDEILRAIDHILNGQKYYSNKVAAKLLEPYCNDSVSDLPNLKVGRILTQRELEIIKYIASGQTNEEIATMLCISKRTVDTHRQNVMNKINVRNCAALVKYAIEHELLKED